MKILVFAIVHWDNQSESEKLRPVLSEWQERVIKHYDNPNLFLSLGTHSDLTHKPLNCDFVDLEISRQINRNC